MAVRLYKAQGISSEVYATAPTIQDISQLDKASADANREIILFPQNGTIQANERPQWTAGVSGTLAPIWGTVTATTTVVQFSQPGIWQWRVSGRGAAGTGGHQWGITAGGCTFMTNNNNTTNSEMFALWAQNAGYNSQYEGKLVITQPNTQIYLTCLAQATNYLNVFFKALNPVTDPTNIVISPPNPATN